MQLKPEVSSVSEDGRVYELVVESTVPIPCLEDWSSSTDQCSLSLKLSTDSQGDDSMLITVFMCHRYDNKLHPKPSCRRRWSLPGCRSFSVLLCGGSVPGPLQGRRVQPGTDPLQPGHRLCQGRWQDEPNLCPAHRHAEFSVEWILATSCSGEQTKMCGKGL